MSRPLPAPEVDSADHSLTASEHARYSQLMLKIDAYLNKNGTSPTEADFAEWKGLLTKKVEVRKNTPSIFGSLEYSLSAPVVRNSET
jgi:hypothetical protein